MDMNIFKRDPGIPTLDVVIKHHKAVFDVAEKHPRGGAKTTPQLATGVAHRQLDLSYRALHRTTPHAH